MLGILSGMEKKSDNLGTYLAVARSRKGLSLRAVEAETGISNAYLSQLETGKIREPSPSNLHKLGELYGVSYATLLELAGHPVPGVETRRPSESGIAARLGPTTKEEEEALADYLAFLRTKRSRGGR
jgi:HTH-type transcriptional regulator, competence development regulator